MQNSPNPKLILIPCDHSQFRIFSNAKENEIHWGNIKISSCTPYQKSRHWRNSKIVHVLIVWSRQVLSRHFVQRSSCFCRDVRTLYFIIHVYEWSKSNVSSRLSDVLFSNNRMRSFFQLRFFEPAPIPSSVRAIVEMRFEDCDLPLDQYSGELCPTSPELVEDRNM